MSVENNNEGELHLENKIITIKKQYNLCIHKKYIEVVIYYST